MYFLGPTNLQCIWFWDRFRFVYTRQDIQCHTCTCQPSWFYWDSPNFQEFQPVNIPVFKVIFKDIHHTFLVFFSANAEEIQIFFIDLNEMYDWLMDFSAEFSAQSICFNLPLPPALVCVCVRGGGVLHNVGQWWKCPDFWFPNVGRYMYAMLKTKCQYSPRNIWL